MTSSAKNAYLSFYEMPKGWAVYNAFKQFLYGPGDLLTRHIFDAYLFPVLLERQNDESRRDTVFTMCDIGCGDGVRAAMLLAKAHLYFPKIPLNLLAIEPSQAGYRAAWDNLRQATSFASVRRVKARFEDVDLGSMKFDFVTAIHSIFTLPDDGEDVSRLVALPREKGCALVVANQPGGLLSKLNQEFHKGYATKRFEMADFLAHLCRLRTPYERKSFPFEFRVPPEKKTKFCMAILSQVTMGGYPNLSRREQQAGREFLESLAVRREGRSLVFSETEDFLKISPAPL